MVLEDLSQGRTPSENKDESKPRGIFKRSGRLSLLSCHLLFQMLSKRSRDSRRRLVLLSSRITML